MHIQQCGSCGHPHVAAVGNLDEMALPSCPACGCDTFRLHEHALEAQQALYHADAALFGGAPTRLSSRYTVGVRYALAEFVRQPPHGVAAGVAAVQLYPELPGQADDHTTVPVSIRAFRLPPDMPEAGDDGARLAAVVAGVAAARPDDFGLLRAMTGIDKHVVAWLAWRTVVDEDGSSIRQVIAADVDERIYDVTHDHGRTRILVLPLDRYRDWVQKVVRDAGDDPVGPNMLPAMVAGTVQLIRLTRDEAALAGGGGS